LYCFLKIRHPKLRISGNAVFAITEKIVTTKATGRLGTGLNKRKRSFITDPSTISQRATETEGSIEKGLPQSLDCL
jgi:hypothetical protein